MLTFEPISHTYCWNGAVVPSVTQVLQDVDIIDYSFLPPGTREMALSRGRDVHEATHFDDEGDLDDSWIAENPGHASYIEAWRLFRAQTGFIPDMIEHRAFNERYGFAGTLDRSGTFSINGQGKADAIVDLKCGDAPGWARLQTAAYCSFFDSPRRFVRLVVELHKDGSYRLFRYEGKDWQADFNGFLAALAVYRLKREFNQQSYRQRHRKGQDATAND